MPNECSNFLTVVGDPKELSEFIKVSKNPKGSEKEYAIFQNNYPCPQELYEVDANFTKKPDMIAKHGASDWYDWCNMNWGTKWGDYHTDLSHYNEGDTMATFTYTTAWGPGVNGLIGISREYPNLVFVNSYEEGGCELVGSFGVANGDLLSDVEGKFPDYPTDKDGEPDWDQMDEYMESVHDVMERCEGQVIYGLADDIRKLFKTAIKG